MTPLGHYRRLLGGGGGGGRGGGGDPSWFNHLIGDVTTIRTEREPAGEPNTREPQL